MNKLKYYLNKFNNLSNPAKASVAFVICSFLQRGISVITTPIFTRILTTDQYGYYSIVISWLDIISVFATLRLSGSVYMQAIIKYKKQEDEITTSTMGLGTFWVITSFFVYFIFRKFINPVLELDTKVVIMIFALCWTGFLFDLWAAKLRSEYNYKPLIIITILISLFKPLFGIISVLAVNENKAYARIMSQTFVELVCCSWIFFYFYRRCKKLYNAYFWKYSLSLNIPLIPHYLTRMALNQCDKVMINYMIGSSEAGIYSLAHSLAWVLTLFTSSILNSFNPWIFDSIKSKNYKEIEKMTNAILIVVAVIGVMIVAIAPEIVYCFAPVDYYDAMWIVPPLCMSVYFMFLYGIFATFEYYYEKTKYIMYASILGGMLNIVLNYLGISKFGMYAAGYTTLICYIFYVLVHYICMRLVLSQNKIQSSVFGLKTIVLISIGFLIIGFGFMFLFNHRITRWGMLLFGCALTYKYRNKIVILVDELRKKE